MTDRYTPTEGEKKTAMFGCCLGEATSGCLPWLVASIVGAALLSATMRRRHG